MTMIHFVKVVKSQARELKVSSSARVTVAPHVDGAYGTHPTARPSRRVRASSPSKLGLAYPFQISTSG